MECHIVVYILLLITVVNYAVQTDICNSIGICKCVRDQKSGALIAVNCVCTQTIPNLILSQIQVNSVSQANRFSIANCSKVAFEPDSFKSVTQLHILSVKRCNTVIFTPGVFQSLNDLIVEDVGDLVLKEKAFIGARGVFTMSVKRSTIKELPRHALHDVKGLRKLEMIDVALGNVQKEAVNIYMEDMKSEFSIINSTVENIEDEAIIIRANDIHFYSTTVRSVQMNGIQMTGDQVLIEKCMFGEELTENGVDITTRMLNITGNLFNVFYIGMFAHLHQQKQEKTDVTSDVSLSVNKNTILRLDISSTDSLLDSGNEGFKNIQIKDNRITCDCQVSQLIPLTWLHDKMRELVDENYCNMQCKNIVPLNKLENQCVHDQFLNTSLFCEAFESASEEGSTTSSTTIENRHGGRGMQFTTEKSTMNPHDNKQHGHSDGQHSDSNSSGVFISVSVNSVLLFAFARII